MIKRRPTGRWGLYRGGLVSLGLLAALAAGGPSLADGIPLGKFQFYPSVSIGLAEDNNIFNQNEDILAGRVRDTTADLEAPLVLHLPFRASLWELTYTPGLKQYHDNGDLDGDTHQLSTQLDLVFSTGSRLTAQGLYVRDYSNLQEASEQLSESQFTFVDYEIIRANLEYEQPLGQRNGVEAILDFESIEFDDTVVGSFTETQDLGLTLSYVRLLGRDMRIFAGVLGGSNDLDQPSRDRVNCNQDAACIFQEVILRGEAREDRWTVFGGQVGLERQFDNKNRARLDLGYQVLEFDHSDDSDYSGLTAHLAYSRRFSDALSVSGDFTREPVQSTFDVNNYFLMNRVLAGVRLRPRGSSLYYGGALSFQTSVYPDETELLANREFNRRREDFRGGGVHRRDKVASLSVVMGMRFSELSSLEFTVAARQRDSNLELVNLGLNAQGQVVDNPLDRLDYDDLVFGLTFRYGFFPQRDFI